MKRLNNLLNIIIGVCFGIFIGHGLYVTFDYYSNPELYAFQSAPWYTSIVVYGGLTVAVAAVCIIIKLCLKYMGRNK